MDAYQGSKKYIFASYAHKDNDVVLPIIELMQKNGFRVWYDKGIEAGTEWAAYIEEHLLGCDKFVLFLSKASIESINCREEFGLARLEEKDILVIYIEDLKDSDLRYGLRLRIPSHQALMFKRHPSMQSFMYELCRARILQSCRSEEVDDDDEETVEEGFTSRTVEAEETLAFELCDDGVSYYIKGRGSCTDREIAVPSTYKNMSVTSIGVFAFSGADTVYSITLPNSVTTIRERAFSKCPNLESVTISANLTKIGPYAFSESTKLTAITFEGTKKEWNAIVDGSPNWSKDSTITVVHCSNGDISMTTRAAVRRNNAATREGLRIEVADDGASCYVKGLGTCTDAEIEIPAQYDELPVTAIGGHAFDRYTTLTGITIPEGVTKIGGFAFSKCTELVRVSIPSTVTSIGEFAFSGCEKLEEITIPASVTSVGNYLFGSCSALTSIRFGGTKAEWEALMKDANDWNLGCPVASVRCKNGVISIIEETTPVVSTAQIDESGDYTDVLQFTLNSKENTYTVKGMENYSGESIVIPATYAGLPVKTIGGHAFDTCTTLRSVVISEGVETIGGYAFSECANLESVHIPESVTAIGKYAFHKCKKLASVVIPSGVTCVEKEAFSKCSALASVVLPSGLTSIDRDAFNGCSSLSEIRIPASVKVVDYCAFNGCTKLTMIDVDPASETYCSMDGHLYSKDMTTLLRYASGKTDAEFALPEGITLIEREAFSGSKNLRHVILPASMKELSDRAFVKCKSLERVTLPDSMERLGVLAFAECTSLETVTLPSGLKKFAWYVFSGCASLRKVEIPNGVDLIGGYTFAGCKSLSELTIPETVTSVSSAAFSECESLKAIRFLGPKKKWNAAIASDKDWNEGSSIAVVYCTDGEIHYQDMIEPEESADDFGNEDDVNYDEILIFSVNTKEQTCSVKGMNDYTGATLVIPAEHDGYPVTAITTNAFDGCKNLRRIVIPEGVTTIGGSAFSECESLESIEFPDSLTTIGRDAFRKCKSLVSITLPKQLEEIEKGMFSECTALTSIAVPEGTKYIEQNAFDRCTALREVALSAAVRSVRQYAFSGCSALETFTVAEGNERFCAIDGHLYSKDGETLIRYASGNSASAFYIPEGVKDIEREAFSGSKYLRRVVLPESMKEVPEWSFKQCDSLESITLHAGITKINVMAFSDCVRLESVLLPESVKNIAWYAFSGCTRLSEVTVPATVTSMGGFLFDGCTSLKQIIFSGTKRQFLTVSHDDAEPKDQEGWDAGSVIATVLCTDGSYTVKK